MFCAKQETKKLFLIFPTRLYTFLKSMLQPRYVQTFKNFLFKIYIRLFKLYIEKILLRFLKNNVLKYQ